MNNSTNGRTAGKIGIPVGEQSATSALRRPPAAPSVSDEPVDIRETVSAKCSALGASPPAEIPGWPVVIHDHTEEPLGSMEAYCNQTSRLPEFVDAPSKEAVQIRLRNRLVPDDPDLSAARPEEKIRALVHFDRGYLATEEVCRFTVSLVSAFVGGMRSRALDNPRYRRYFGSFLDHVQGAARSPARESIDTLSGINFVVKGCSQMGRTAYVQRLRQLFGPPFRVVRPGAEFPQLWYFPIVVLRWPTCGTPEGLYKQFREKLISELKDPTDLRPILRKATGERAPTALIALCVLLNVGLLVIDGACAESIRCGMREILCFLSTLQGHTNVPLLISCSEVFHYEASRVTREGANVLKGKVLTLRPLAPPLPTETDRTPGLWYMFNLWLWRAGLIPKAVPMPRELPVWTHELTLGRIGWLTRGFRELHDRLAWEPDLLSGGVAKALVVEVFESQLTSESEARVVIQQLRDDPHNAISERKLAPYLDHLPAAGVGYAYSTPFLAQSGGGRA